MRAKLVALMVLLVLASFIAGCIATVGSDSEEKWAHDERMAEIKAGKMNKRERAEFADMVADKVDERLKQQEK